MAHRILTRTLLASCFHGGSSMQKFQAGDSIQFKSVSNSTDQVNELSDVGTDDGAVAGGYSSTCVPLANYGTFSTLPILVGTPGQRLNVIADSGSNFLIVNDCVCKNHGRCRHQDACFRGTGRSSTFSMRRPAKRERFNFVSGEVDAVVATDTVKLGSISANMKNSLLLMYNHMLHINGNLKFEGLLGLGVPGSHIGTFRAPTFMQQARAGSFSICMNTGRGPTSTRMPDGALSVGSRMPGRRVSIVGRKHWATHLHGVGVGTRRYSLCTGSTGRCGAIIDSGTTNIMGPRAQVSRLFGKICDAWPRCKRLAGGRFQGRSSSDAKATHFMHVLRSSCSHLSELPTIRFKLTDGNGGSKVVKLNPHHYIIMTNIGGYRLLVEDQLGEMLPVEHQAQLLEGAKSERFICGPAFGVSHLNAGRTGPIWLLGTPIFYRYTVHFALRRPALAFESRRSKSCSCDSSQDLFASGVSEIEGDDKNLQRLRFVEGPFRTPSYNITDADF